jgi:hypothetical protein
MEGLRDMDRLSSRVRNAWVYFGGGLGGLKADAGLDALAPADFIDLIRLEYEQFFKPVLGPVVSVVIPVFEGTSETGRLQEMEDREFRRAMGSLIHNNRPLVPTEVILVVNGLLPRESRFFGMGQQMGLRVVARQHGDGRHYDLRPQNIFRSRQAGMDQSRGDIILHGDSDNLFSDYWINAYYLAYRDNPKLLLAYGPVAMYGATNLWGYLLLGLSLICKTVQILRGRPRYAGPNHAIKRQVMTLRPGLYDLCQMHENEIPRLVATTCCASTAVPKLVRAAIVCTRMGKQEESLRGFIHWLRERIRVNLRAH